MTNVTPHAAVRCLDRRRIVRPVSGFGRSDGGRHGQPVVDLRPVDGPSSSWSRVSDEAAARWLVDPVLRGWIAPFVGRERTLADVSRELGMPLNAVQYRARRMLDLDLLRVVGTRPRRGRAMKVYTTAGRGFVVPVSALPSQTLEALLLQNELTGQRALTRGLVRAVERGPEQGHLVVRVELDAAGGLAAGLARDDASFDLASELTSDRFPAVWSSWSTVSLTHTDAKALQRELAAVWSRYQESAGTSTHTSPYTLRIALVPDR